MNHASVLIAGGGPVGMTLALELASHGVRSILVERNATTTRHPKMDLTNGRSMELYRRLGLSDRLRRAGVPEDHVFDIEACGYVPKPDPAGYDALVRRFAIVPARAVMIEDMAKNLAPAAALGMTTVWLRGTVEWAREGAEADYVHHVAEALTPWLAAIVAERAIVD